MTLELTPDLVEAAVQLAMEVEDPELATALRRAANRVILGVNPTGAYARRGLGLVTADAVEHLDDSLTDIDARLAELLLGDTAPDDWQPGHGVDWAALGLPGAPRDLDRDDPILSALRLMEPPAPRPWRQLAEDRGGGQLPPPGDWVIWLILAGRGFGKTWTGANVLAEWAVESPGDYALVAPTFGDARKICVEERKSGLLTALGDDLLDYNKSDYIVHVRGGSRIVLGSADAPGRLRGYNFSGAWLDELASYVNLSELWEEVLQPALRIGRLPRTVITTTGKRGNPVLKELLERYAQGDTTVAITRGKTSDNLRNLSEAFVVNIYARYGGTATGRQELDGELLDEVEGALVSGQLIERTRLRSELLVPELRRIVVGVDPAVSDSEKSDQCGIVVMGIGPPPIGATPRHTGDHLYVLQDATLRAHPEVWALTALKIAQGWRADAIVAERNNGGQLVDSMLRMVAKANTMPVPRIYTPWASRGKLTRAEPLSGVWQQGRVHVVGALPEFEDQWTSWVPGHGPSPDALDASVWAGVTLMPELSVDGPREVRLLA